MAAFRANFGSEIGVIDGKTHFAFPTVEQLADKAVTEEKLRALGYGYRANYIVAAVKMIKEKGGSEWLTGLRKLPLDEVRTELTTLKGVGRKVADCVALFSMDKAGTIPVDTHVFQIA